MLLLLEAESQQEEKESVPRLLHTLEQRLKLGHDSSSLLRLLLAVKVVRQEMNSRHSFPNSLSAPPPTLHPALGEERP